MKMNVAHLPELKKFHHISVTKFSKKVFLLATSASFENHPRKNTQCYHRRVIHKLFFFKKGISDLFLFCLQLSLKTNILYKKCQDVIEPAQNDPNVVYG